jgi:hypothetical protein
MIRLRKIVAVLQTMYHNFVKTSGVHRLPWPLASNPAFGKSVIL